MNKSQIRIYLTNKINKNKKSLFIQVGTKWWLKYV